MKKMVITAFLLTVLTGCSNANYKTGTAIQYDSLADLRAANVAVKVYEEIPDNASEITTIKAERCHRDWNDPAPTEATLIINLKMQAYAYGFDGIKIGVVEKNSGLMKNCWYLYTATAEAFKVRR